MALWSVAAGCSSGADEGGIGGPNKCGLVPPCGGDLVGSWTIDGACADPDAPNASIDQVKALCPDLTYQSSYDASGTASFTATTYSIDVDLMVTATAHVPKSCLQGLSCGALNGFFQEATGGDTGATISCTGSADCTCAIAAPESRVESGSYTTSQTTYTSTPSGGTPTSSPYCVNGATLHIITLGDDGTSIFADIIGKR